MHATKEKRREELAMLTAAILHAGVFRPRSIDKLEVKESAKLSVQYARAVQRELDEEERN